MGNTDNYHPITGRLSDSERNFVIKPKGGRYVRLVKQLGEKLPQLQGGK